MVLFADASDEPIDGVVAKLDGVEGHRADDAGGVGRLLWITVKKVTEGPAILLGVSIPGKGTVIGNTDIETFQPQTLGREGLPQTLGLRVQ